MKTSLTILGCGNSLGVPRIDNYWGYCDKKKITFLSTPFDEKSAIFLNKIGVPAFKISSGDMDNFLLLSTIKKFKKPIILSTGMSVISDVKNTVKFLSLKKNELAIMWILIYNK